MLSSAIAKGLYHPRCKDSHTTYFPGISTADDSWTKEELATLGQEYEQEQKQQYAERQADRFSRLAEYSLDEDNRKKYAARAEEWKKKFVVGDNEARDRLGLITNNNKSNPRYYDYKNKGLSEVEKEIGKLDYEVAVAFDKNGKAVFCQLGIEDTIKFTKYQLSKMKGLDVTHNHPLSTPPSPEDLYLLVKHKANSFRTCGKNGTYVLEYNEQIERLPEFETFSYEYNKLLVELTPKIVKKYFNGSNEREVLIKLGDAIWEELYKKYGVKPRFERR